MKHEAHDHYIQLAERLERLAYDLRGRSQANVIDLLEAAQFVRDRMAEMEAQTDGKNQGEARRAAGGLEDQP